MVTVPLSATMSPGVPYFTQEYLGTDKNGYSNYKGWRFCYSCEVVADYKTKIKWELGPYGAENFANNTWTQGGAKISILSKTEACGWRTLNYNSDVGTADDPDAPGGNKLLTGWAEISHDTTTGSAEFVVILETATHYKPTDWGGGDTSDHKLFKSTLTCSVPQNPASWACTSPTCTVGEYIKGSNGQVTLTWSGAQDGGGNTVAGYNIYYAFGNSTPTSSSSHISFDSTDKSGSKIIYLGSNLNRGAQVKFAIQAYGTQKDKISDLNQSSNSSYVNRLPSEPTCSYYLYSDQNCTSLVPSSQDTIFPSGGAYVKFNATAGSDSDSGQTRTVWYSIGDGTKQQYNSSTGLVYTLSANTTINFYTYDGYEYGSAQSFTFTKNTPPTLSNSTYTASSLSPESGVPNPYVVTLKATANGLSHRISASKFNVYFQYSTTTSGPWTKTTDPIVFSGLSKAEFTILDVRARIPLSASSALYYKVYVQQDDGIETLKEVQVGETYKLNAIPTGDGINTLNGDKSVEGLENYISSVFKYRLKSADKGYAQMYLRIVDSGLREFKTNKVEITNYIQASFENISSPTLSGESLTIYPVLCTNTFEQELAGIEYLTISPIISLNTTTLNTGYVTTPYCPFSFDTEAKNISFTLAQFMLTTEKDESGALKIGKHGITASTDFKLSFLAGSLIFKYSDFKVIDGASGQYLIEISDADLWSKLSNKTANGQYDDNVTLSYTDSFGATYTTKPGVLKITYQGPMEVTSFSLYYMNFNGSIVPLTDTTFLKENMDIYLGATVKGFNPTPSFKIVQKIGEKENVLRELSGSLLDVTTSINRLGQTEYTYVIKDSSYSYTKIASLGENSEGGLDGVGAMASFQLLPKNAAYQDYSSNYSKTSAQYRYVRHTEGIMSLSRCEYSEPDIAGQTIYMVAVDFKIFDFGISESLENNTYVAELYMSPQNSDNYASTGKTVSLKPDDTHVDFDLGNSFTGAQKIRVLVKVTNTLNGISSYHEFFSNSLTIFNTSSFPPTVSYRKNFLGFNIVNPEAGQYNDCIIVFGEAPNPSVDSEEPVMRNKIRFVSGGQSTHCIIDGFKISGGSWDADQPDYQPIGTKTLAPIAYSGEMADLEQENITTIIISGGSATEEI